MTPKLSRASSAKRRRALELLAASPYGCTEAIMLAHGFTADFLVNLIRAGMVTTWTERVDAGGRAMEVIRVPHQRSQAACWVVASFE